MKNLKNLNLQELTMNEQINTDGGCCCLIAAGVGVAGIVGVKVTKCLISAYCDPCK